jgi:hypothetical protein
MTVTRFFGTLAAWLFAAGLVTSALALALQYAWLEYLTFWLRAGFAAVTVLLVPWLVIAGVVHLVQRNRPARPSDLPSEPMRLPL